MLERFGDYMYYLLTAPFKRVRKEVNQWYLLFKVFGARFDRAKEALQQARDETMVATCSQVMLQEHGRDRGLTRYEGEKLENYRKRIALYEQVCRLGGTNEGIILAVTSLGFDDVAVIPAREYYGDSNRWAEFVVVVNYDAGAKLPIGFDILKNTVRKWKEVGAKDNYCMDYHTKADKHYAARIIKTDYKKYVTYFDYLMLDGMWLLDGSQQLCSRRGWDCTVRWSHGDNTEVL